MQNTSTQQVPAAPPTHLPAISGYTADERKAAWAEIHERHEVAGKAAPSATARRLGSRAAAVYDAIFRTLNVPDDIARLIMFLAAMAEGQREFTAYRGELANAYFDEADTEKADRERAQQSREQRFGRLISAMNDWQAENDCWLIQYFPGFKITAELSEKGKFTLPVLDLFSRVYTESRSTSAFQATRDAKLKRVTEAVITAEFRDIPPPGRKRKPRSMSRNARLEREQKIILSRMARLIQELTDDEREKFTAELAGFIPLGTKEESSIQPAGSEKSLYKNSDTFVENKGLAGNLGALVEGSMGSCGGAPRSSLPSSDSLKAVELFASVGVTEFGETTMIEDRPDYQVLSLDTMRQEVDDRIVAAESWSSSYIVRPVVSSDSAVKLIHLDDFNQDCRSEIKTMAFIGFKTSLEKEQAYIAVRMPDPADNAERLRVRRALIKHFKADPSATAASRFPGSNNRKYTPAYPVTVTIENPGRIIEYSEIEHLLPALPAPVKPRSYKPSSRRPFPDWTIEESLRPTRVNADWWWTLKALDRERGIEETIEELLRVSSKAKEKGRAYAADTVRNAAAAMGIV